jgi:hypothetical protein
VASVEQSTRDGREPIYRPPAGWCGRAGVNDHRVARRRHRWVSQCAGYRRIDRHRHTEGFADQPTPAGHFVLVGAPRRSDQTAAATEAHHAPGPQLLDEAAAGRPVAVQVDTDIDRSVYRDRLQLPRGHEFVDRDA